MKNLFFALLSISLFLAACAAPQASVVTQTPPAAAIPTPPRLTKTPVSPNTTELSQTTQALSPTATSDSKITTWVPPAMPTAGEKLSFESLDMSDPDSGWGIDSLGRIFHTSDGGQTWAFASPPDGVYTGNGFFALDGLTAWAAKDVPVRCWDYWSIYQCDRLHHAAVTSGTVWKTADGGRSWQPGQSFPLNVEL